MSRARLRTVPAVSVLLVVGLAAGCRPGDEPATPPTTASAAPAASSAAEAAGGDAVCQRAVDVIRTGFVAMADDAIKQIDQPVSEPEKQRLIREHYTTIAAGLREQAPQAVDPAVRTAVEDLAAAIEQRLSGTEPLQVDEPQLERHLTSVDRACGN